MTKQATRALHAGINCYFASDRRIWCITIALVQLRSQCIRDEVNALPAVLPDSNLGCPPPSLFVRFKFQDGFYFGLHVRGGGTLRRDKLHTHLVAFEFKSGDATYRFALLAIRQIIASIKAG